MSQGLLGGRQAVAQRQSSCPLDPCCIMHRWCSTVGTQCLHRSCTDLSAAPADVPSQPPAPPCPPAAAAGWTAAVAAGAAGSQSAPRMPAGSVLNISWSLPCAFECRSHATLQLCNDIRSHGLSGGNLQWYKHHCCALHGKWQQAPVGACSLTRPASG